MSGRHAKPPIVELEAVREKITAARGLKVEARAMLGTDLMGELKALRDSTPADAALLAEIRSVKREIYIHLLDMDPQALR